MLVTVNQFLPLASLTHISYYVNWRQFLPFLFIFKFCRPKALLQYFQRSIPRCNEWPKLTSAIHSTMNEPSYICFYWQVPGQSRWVKSRIGLLRHQNLFVWFYRTEDVETLEVLRDSIALCYCIASKYHKIMRHIVLVWVSLNISDL